MVGRTASVLTLLLGGFACSSEDGTEVAPTAEPTSSAQEATAAVPSAPATSTAPLVVYENEVLPHPGFVAKTLEEQREAMIRRMRKLGMFSGNQEKAFREVLESGKWIGQGNPGAVEHPLTRQACMDRRAKAGVKEEVAEVCDSPYMAPVYDPKTQKPNQAKVCIDRYEFPNMPCDYPVTWVTTKRAQKICQSLGKRLCDAHEWEGACAGKLLPAEQEYRFGGLRTSMRWLHNKDRDIRWAYGKDKDHSKCGTASHQSKGGCSPIKWSSCGSNTYPAGSFPECRSPLGVYDQHGNAAEHMLLPMEEKDLGSKGGQGVPEMKGSWFIWSSKEAHDDDCRWRAPAWHDNEGMNHKNYHLSFRCCKDVGG